MARADALSGSKDRGSRTWFGHFQTASRQVKDGLNEDEKAELEDLREAWNSKGPDEKVQAE